MSWLVVNRPIGVYSSAVPAMAHVCVIEAGVGFQELLIEGGCKRALRCKSLLGVVSNRNFSSTCVCLYYCTTVSVNLSKLIYKCITFFTRFVQFFTHLIFRDLHGFVYTYINYEYTYQNAKISKSGSNSRHCDRFVLVVSITTYRFFARAAAHRPFS